MDNMADLKKSYELYIDGPLLRRQRALIDSFLAGSSVRDGENHLLLAGLQGLLDEIADQACDKYGIDCLLVEDP